MCRFGNSGHFHDDRRGHSAQLSSVVYVTFPSLNVFMVWAGGDAARCVLLAAVKWGAGSVAYRELDDAADADTANSSSCLHSAKSPSAGQDFNVAVHLMLVRN